MTVQISQFRNLPPLSSPALVRSRSRLERSLLRLSQMSELVMQHYEMGLLAEEAHHGEATPDDVWANLQPLTSDRRAFPRREGNCKVAVCRLSSGNDSLTSQQIEWRLHATSIKGTLGDISLNGAAVLLLEPLPIGETVVLRLFSPRRDKHLDQQALVLRNLPEVGNSKVICQFTQKLSLEQVSYFSRFLNDSGWM